MAYTGKILRINLSTGKATTEPLNERWAHDYLGGKGLSIKYLFEELAPGIDPLSPDNKLVLMTGPTTGTIVPNSGKLAVAAKSPATGTILDCSIGGRFAPELKYAGYDAAIIEGKSKVPVYLVVEDDKVELRSAAKLWGKGAHETEYILQDILDDFVTMVIGPAGENLLPMACINSELYRQAGRGGIGAVMGSKNLKAVAVKGSGGVKIPNIRKFSATMNKIKREDTMTDVNMWAYSDGTPMIVDLCQTTGILPTRNFQEGTFEQYEQINSEAVKAVRKAKKACFACPLACGNYVQKGKATVEGPEYETLALCSSNCGISDLEAVIEFNRLCDDYGLDTISTGNAVAFAMEMTEKGLHDFGIRFGDIENYLKMPALMANREGVGADLALGVRTMAAKYGGTEFAMAVKGLEMPGYEPRGSWAMGLAYGTSDRGACHMRAWPVSVEAFGDIDPFTIESKAELVKGMQDNNATKFCVILCDFWALSNERIAEILSLVLDRTMTVEELARIGDRVYNVARLFNEREGFDRKDDYLPDRIFTEKLTTGATAGKLLPREEYEKMLTEYYRLRGWDDNGKITIAKKKELGL
ncbi:MAG TPA: aldehyde ferredoxin oxidoreductase family protein [Candidatus Limnocylindrales bacterium]|nr:aldehyde ferredoxin oxidoreductase family protein [Candidatus Limnocylindrales bacterium]